VRAEQNNATGEQIIASPARMTKIFTNLPVGYLAKIKDRTHPKKRGTIQKSWMSSSESEDDEKGKGKTVFFNKKTKKKYTQAEVNANGGVCVKAANGALTCLFKGDQGFDKQMKARDAKAKAKTDALQVSFYLLYINGAHANTPTGTTD
jgi:hypothetical protein